MREDLADPQGAIMADLNQKLDAFFCAGSASQEIAPGVSSERELTPGSNHGSRLRTERHKLAPHRAGIPLYKAVEALGIDLKRVKLIARESSAIAMAWSIPTSRRP